jgi:hypothetical protein
VDPALEEVLQRASGLLCHWLGQAGHGTPLPGLSVLPVVEPEAAGLGSDRLLADLQLVMEGAYNPNHPGALAHLDPPPLSASIVADLICAGLNNNLLAEELSPSLSRLERALCAWMAASYRYLTPHRSIGVRQSSAENDLRLGSSLTIVLRACSWWQECMANSENYGSGWQMTAKSLVNHGAKC